MPDVFEEIENKIKEMYNLEREDVAIAVEAIQNILNLCALDNNQEPDPNDLDVMVKEIVEHFNSIDENLKDSEENLQVMED